VKISDYGLNFLKDFKYADKRNDDDNFFLAPEVCMGGRAKISEKSDVWRCGIVLYFMKFRMLPFEDSYFPDLFHKIRTVE
jgi:serine/threonine protein kinase